MKARIALKVILNNAQVTLLDPSHFPNKVQLSFSPENVVRGYKKGTLRQAIKRHIKWQAGTYRFPDGGIVEIL